MSGWSYLNYFNFAGQAILNEQAEIGKRLIIDTYNSIDDNPPVTETLTLPIMGYAYDKRKYIDLRTARRGEAWPDVYELNFRDGRIMQTFIQDSWFRTEWIHFMAIREKIEETGEYRIVEETLWDEEGIADMKMRDQFEKKIGL